MSRYLLLGIEERGQDATGAAWRVPNNNAFCIQKQDVTATEFVRRLCPARSARSMVLHTRAATQGHPRHRVNNHPIAVAGGQVVGVHNGMIWNDQELFWDMGMSAHRIGEVDSEAIFAAIAYGRTKDSKGRYRLGPALKDALEAPQGSAAIAWMEREDPDGTLHLARLNQSPMVLAQTDKGSLLFASTRGALELAAEMTSLTLDWFWDVEEGTYFRVNQGRIEEMWDFEPAWSYSYSGRRTWDDYTAYKSTMKTTTVLGPKKATSTTRLTRVQWQEDEGAEYAFVGNVNDDVALSPWLDGSFLLYDADLADLEAEREKHSQHYPRREADLDAWFAQHEGEKSEPWTADSEVLRRSFTYHAWLRVGDIVSTKVMGQDVPALVTHMPDRFPGGVYYLLAFIPASDRLNTFEKVAIARRDYEFYKLFGDDVADAAEAMGLDHPARIDRIAATAASS